VRDAQDGNDEDGEQHDDQRDHGRGLPAGGWLCATDWLRSSLRVSRLWEHDL